MSCNGNWYRMIIFPGQTLDIASSVPGKIAGRKCTPSPITPSPTYSNGNEEVGSLLTDLRVESSIFVPITMLLGLLFLILILWRSRSRVRLDWYRLIAVYIFVTLGVPLSIALGPQVDGFPGGFNRVIGFGILIHNLGEAFILNHVWFGDVGRNGRNKFSGVGAILYVWFIMALISFVEPLWLLFFVLMLQGSFCDYALVGTFIYLSKTIKPKNTNSASTCCGKPINYGAFGVAASLTHIMTIQPLFYMMAIPTFVAGGAITIVFLMPTFILYLVFSSAQKGKVPRLLQTKSFREMEYELDERRNKLLKKIVDKSGNYELKQRNNGQYNDDNPASNDNEEKEEQEEEANVIDVLSGKDEDSNGVSFDDVVNDGLVHMKLAGGANARRALKIIVAIAVTCCLLNSFIVLFAPCYVPPPC